MRLLLQNVKGLTFFGHTGVGVRRLIICWQSESAGKEFHTNGAETEKVREEKLLVIPDGLATRLVLRRTPGCGRKAVGVI